MDLYSSSLALALVTGGLALIAALAIGSRRLSPPVREQLRRVSRTSLLISAIALTISLVSHVALGHRPGSAQALSPMQFVTTHPAFLVALALAGIAWLLQRRSYNSTLPISRRNHESAQK